MKSSYEFTESVFTKSENIKRQRSHRKKRWISALSICAVCVCIFVGVRGPDGMKQSSDMGGSIDLAENSSMPESQDFLEEVKGTESPEISGDTSFTIEVDNIKENLAMSVSEETEMSHIMEWLENLGSESCFREDEYEEALSRGDISKEELSYIVIRTSRDEEGKTYVEKWYIIGEVSNYEKN